MGLPSKEEIQETTWKWRCKIASLGGNKEKKIDDFASDDSSVVDLKDHKGSVIVPTSKKDASKSKDPDFGGAPVVKTLFEGKNSNENYIDWQDYPPRQISKSAAKAHDRVALKVYKVNDKDKPVIGGRFALKYHRIDVQNPLLIAALEPILKEENFHLDVSETAVFNEPFRELYFSYDKIAALCKSLDSGDELRPFIHLLVKLLDEVFTEVRAKRRQLSEKGLVSFKHAWTYFARESIVISHGSNSDILSKVVDTTYVKRTPFLTVLNVRCKFLIFNGEAFVWEEQVLEIPPFENNKPVAELDHYPLEFHKDADSVKERLRNRGMMVVNCQGLTYANYNGIAIFQEGNNVEKHNVDSRILVDVVGYNKHHMQQGSREGKDPASAKKIVSGTGRMLAAVTDPSKSAKGQGLKRLSEEEIQKNKDAMMKTPDNLMFMAPLVEGFSLKNKLWLLFYVEDIRPIEWNETAYDHLVYEEQQKDLVLSFVESHGQAKAQVDDVIKGKGNGLIILLSGPPGTGKTLTAEAVADKTHRPLFYLQAEDLGINAAALGANVKRVFEMATEWNAVILLDEADVFMANRHPQDIARNELVSIFLRELEYFKGIIFLTTNLFDTIDQAFRSRVSLHLLFTSLSAEARLAVWRKFLDRLPQAVKKVAGPSDGEDGAVVDMEEEGVSEEDLVELSRWDLNGREIKTAVKMVKSWCDHKAYKLNLKRLENGIKATSPRATKLGDPKDTALYD